MTSRKYDPIDKGVAAEIKRLHRRHRKLGHHGLLEALMQADIHVDPKELERFMRQNRITAEHSWRLLRFVSLPKWWIGGPPEPGD